ncbi:hypothetical protein BOTBODRAFT_34722 [Botryobasidium botryosum FD-172 SS1]|uniref:Uncharacterized protein n=1 Tax=Botryobasidium botryosum (strain FD-172 SS1) TaxID=930990 RepID=A0A067M954_BOTB1|nr:hypothetical protein BOTBODRAFT_34722 [Botryobasidium botryosum FD-172 SS1]
MADTYQPTAHPNPTNNGHELYQAITAMPCYTQYSFEELRLYGLDNGGAVFLAPPNTTSNRVSQPKGSYSPSPAGFPALSNQPNETPDTLCVNPFYSTAGPPHPFLASKDPLRTFYPSRSP